MRGKILLIVLVIWATSVSSQNRTVKFLMQLVSQFEKRHICFVFHNDSILRYDFPLELSDMSYILLDTSKPLPTTIAEPTPKVYIVATESATECKSILSSLHLTTYWNPTAHFFIIASKPEDMNEYAKISLLYDIHFFYLVTNDQRVFTYFSFKNGSCGNNTKLRRVKNLSKIFQRHQPTTFNNCSLRIAVAPVPPYVIDPNDPTNPGFEVNVMREIARRSNLTPVFTSHPILLWGQKGKDPRDLYMFRDLKRNKADLVAGLVVADARWYNSGFDGTIIHGFETSYFYLPTVRARKRWILLRVFAKPVWAALAFSGSLVVVAVFLFGKRLENREICKDLKSCCFLLVRMSLSPKRLSTRSRYLRFLLTLWCVTFLLLASAYQSQLIYALLKPRYEDQIQSVEEMVYSSKLKIGGFAGVLEFLHEATGPIYKDIEKKWISCSLDIECLNRTAKEQDIAVLKSERVATYFMQKLYCRKDGAYAIYKLDGFAFTYCTCFALRRGSPFLSRFNSLLVGIIENGLYSKWVKDAADPGKPCKGSTDHLVKLSLQHVRTVFAILFVGHVAATLVFIFEVQHYKRKLKHSYY